MTINKLFYLDHFVSDRLTIEGTVVALITNHVLFHKLVTTKCIIINIKAQWNHRKNKTVYNSVSIKYGRVRYNFWTLKENQTQIIQVSTML